MSKEKINNSQIEAVLNPAEIKKDRFEAQERMRKSLEKEAQKAEIGAVERKNNIHEAQEAAREHAESSKQEKVPSQEIEQESRQEQQSTTKNRQKESFQKTMNTVQSQMSAPSRTFSKIIHNPIIEKVSDTASKTIARPNAILSGSLMALVFTLAIYYIARSNGYPLTGTETIAAFVLGWAIGNIIDYARIVFINKRNR